MLRWVNPFFQYRVWAKEPIIMVISLDFDGISCGVFQRSCKQLTFKKGVRIMQAQMMCPSILKGEANLEVSTETLEHLKMVCDQEVKRCVSVRVVVPRTVVFFRALKKGEERHISYILDTESPWPAGQSTYGLVKHGQQASVWSISHTFQNRLDIFFKDLLSVKYHVLDVDLLAWMRFLILQKQDPVQLYLPRLIQNDWPLFWYAPLIGALYNEP